MNRIDRLFALLLRISDGKLFRADDLASDFELSQRTIYRDLKALAELGVPIRAEAGVGYQLESGYFLPPLLFDKDEAIAVGLALKFLLNHTTGSNRRSADSAFKKLQAVLPKQTRLAATDQLEMIEYTKPDNPLSLEDRSVKACIAAIRDARLLTFRYRGFGREDSDPRTVEPAKLFLSPGTNVWYLDAYCLGKEAWRSFRIDRIEDLVVTKERFARRNGRDEGESAAPAAGEVADLEVRTIDARWIRERQHWSFHEEVPVSDETILMKYRGFESDAFIPWVLSQTRWVQKIEPEPLRALIAEKVERIKNLLT